MQRKKKIIVILLISIVMIVTVAFGMNNGWFGGNKNEHELVLSGNVDVREVSLAFRGSDRLKELLAEEGDKVKMGQVLARLDTRETEMSIGKLKAEILAQESAVNLLHNGTRSEVINQAKARLIAAQANSDDAQLVMKRRQQLYYSEAISRQELDSAIYTAQAAEAEKVAANESYQEALSGPRPEEIRQAEAKLESLKQELARQEYLLSQMELISPVDGVIRSRLLEAGDMASPSLPVFKISLHDKKWIRVYVKETDLARVYEGQGATIYIDSLPDKGISGQVGFISSTAEFTPKTVQTDDLRTNLLYEVRVYVDDVENVLRMGMPATVQLNM